MREQEYAEAQQRLLTRSRCLQEHKLELAVIKTEAEREIVRLEQSIAEDQRQIDDIARAIDAHWHDVFHLPEATAS